MEHSTVTASLAQVLDLQLMATAAMLVVSHAQAVSSTSALPVQPQSLLLMGTAAMQLVSHAWVV
jgi:hypothetical protein